MFRTSYDLKRKEKRIYILNVSCNESNAHTSHKWNCHRWTALTREGFRQRMIERGVQMNVIDGNLKGSEDRERCVLDMCNEPISYKCWLHLWKYVYLNGMRRRKSTIGWTSLSRSHDKNRKCIYSGVKWAVDLVIQRNEWRVNLVLIV